MFGCADFAARETFVESSVVGMNCCDIQMRNNISIDCHILSNLIAFAVRDFLSVQFPWYFRCWITAGDATQKHRWTWMQGLFGECLTNDRWVDCKSHGKNKKNSQALKKCLMEWFQGNLHRPPSLSSALAWALSWSLRITHWYMPLSSFLTDSMRRMASECPIDLPSFNHETVLIGLPEKWQVNTAGRPKSTVCVGGSIFADNGAVTVSTVSTLSPPTELLTTHKYFPESSMAASLMIRVPDTCFTRSFNTTACLFGVPSMNLYHLNQK